jgi:hypothetical protein
LWGGQSWLPPAFQPAMGSDNTFAEPPEKAAAARIGCPTAVGIAAQCEIMVRTVKRAHAQRGRKALGILLACSPCAFALNPSLDISQYAHTSWKIRDGFTRGIITSMAQTPDGYLWLGTEFGLLRFDGVRNVP